jgi:hypothetical protein
MLLFALNPCRNAGCPAFCKRRGAESAELARRASATDRDTPLTGCNGYPFSKMNRVIIQSASVDVTSLDGVLDRSGREPVTTAVMDHPIEEEISAPYRCRE